MAVAGVTQDHEADRSAAHSALRFLAISSVMGGLGFNFLLCFVNTRVMGIRDSHVMLMELMIIGAAFLVAADRRAAIPAKRFGDPAEFGAACAFLCSAHAGYITGQSLLIDGGAFPGVL